MKLLVQWLKANRIQLNVAKTEVVLFKNSSKRMDYNIKIKLDSKLMRFSKCTKYLGLLIDENLSFHNHIENVISKLRKANAALCMIRHYVPFTILRSIYFSLFQPHIYYGLQIWGTKFMTKIENKQTSKNCSASNYCLLYTSDAADE